MGTNTRICSMALVALLTTACGGGDSPSGTDPDNEYNGWTPNPNNPLNPFLTGVWINADSCVDPEAPTCEWARLESFATPERWLNNPPGDLYIFGFPPHVLILYGENLHIDFGEMGWDGYGARGYADGRVLDGGQRVVYDFERAVPTLDPGRETETEGHREFIPCSAWTGPPLKDIECESSL